jgi:hypothetical protein
LNFDPVLVIGNYINDGLSLSKFPKIDQSEIPGTMKPTTSGFWASSFP